MSMWTWTCTKCGTIFTRAEKSDAQLAFFSHTVERHPGALVLSMDLTKEDDL